MRLYFLDGLFLAKGIEWALWTNGKGRKVKASELFKQLDVDGSGKVSFEEILLCIASVSFCQDDLLESLYKRSSPETKIPELFHARTLPAQEVSPLAFEQQDNPKDRRTNPRFNRIVSLNHSRVDNDHEADGQRNRVSVLSIQRESMFWVQNHEIWVRMSQNRQIWDPRPPIRSKMTSGIHWDTSRTPKPL